MERLAQVTIDCCFFDTFTDSHFLRYFLSYVGDYYGVRAERILGFKVLIMLLIISPFKLINNSIPIAKLFLPFNPNMGVIMFDI